MDFLIILVLNIIKIYQFAILIRVLLSWIPAAQNNRFGLLIYQATEPFLGLIRRLVPSMGMIDFSPLIALLILSFAQKLILGSFII